MGGSKFDTVYQDLFDSIPNKSGTSYERLTAFVLKSLNKEDIVIHDIRLIGESEVKHQIDVTIEADGRKKRTLIECKDFDVSGNKVGLGIVRDFWGVVDDIHPDQSLIITCNGFTVDAQKYAKSKNIKLAVLREFKESDWEGRVKTICIDMTMMHISPPRLGLYFNDEGDMTALQDAMVRAGLRRLGVRKGQPVFLNLKDERVQINEYVERKANEYPRDEPGPVELKLDLTGSTIELAETGGIPIKGIGISFEIFHSKEYFEVKSDKIAKLILENLDGTDIVICEEDLKKLRIDPESGEICV